MAKVLVPTKGMPRDEWLAWRRRGIGGSDAAAVAGLDPHKSPTRVWLEKTGQLPEEESGEAARWGLLLEPIIAQEFCERTGKKVRRRNAILQHPEHEWMLANIDREIVGEPALLEIKTVNAWDGKGIDEERIPDRYVIQGQHCLAVTGLQRCYYAILIGGQRLVITHVDRDEELIAQLIEIEREFWRHVETGTPPPPDGSDDAKELLARMYPDADPDSIAVLPAEAEDLVRQWHEAKAAEREAAARRQEAENKLKAMLGDRAIGRLYGIDVVTWKPVTQTRIDTKRLKAEKPDIYQQYATTTTYRRFDVKEVEF